MLYKLHFSAWVFPLTREELQIPIKQGAFPLTCLELGTVIKRGRHLAWRTPGLKKRPICKQGKKKKKRKKSEILGLEEKKQVFK